MILHTIHVGINILIKRMIRIHDITADLRCVVTVNAVILFIKPNFHKIYVKHTNYQKHPIEVSA